MGDRLSTDRQYQIVKVVGRGGFGTVYRARMLGQDGFTRPVALKVLNEEVADDQEFAERLRDEARLLGLLQHRGIVWVDGLMQLDGRWTIVMEYVEGVNLKQLLATCGPVPLGCALGIVRRVAEAFQYAYESPTAGGQVLRLLHRDLKPSNIHLTPDGDVKVLDFGVARAEFQSREAITRSLVLGSLEYMAPERLDGIDTHAGDVYALGAVFFELLTGEPFGRSSGNRERHLSHLADRLELLRDHCDDRDVVSLIMDCLAYDVEARPTAATVGQHARELGARYTEPWLVDWAAGVVPHVQQHLPPVGIDDPLSGSILIEGPARTRPALEHPSSEPTRPRRGLVLAAAALLGLLLLGGLSVSALGGAWLLFRTSPAPSASPAPQPLAPTPSAPMPPPAATDRPEEPGPELLPSADSVEAAAPSPEEILEQGRVEAPPEATRPPEVTPTPAPAPRTTPPPPAAEAPTATPTPTPTPTPAPSSSARGSVVVQGTVADLRLESASGQRYGRGSVPVGTYAVSVSFDGTAYHDAGQVTIHADEQVVLVCRANLKRCVTR